MSYGWEDNLAKIWHFRDCLGH